MIVAFETTALVVVAWPLLAVNFALPLMTRTRKGRKCPSLIAKKISYISMCFHNILSVFVYECMFCDFSLWCVNF